MPDTRSDTLSADARSFASILAIAVLAIIVSPLILMGAVAVRLTSRGPAFYSQTRLGLRGRPFQIYKLRSMWMNCEALTGAQWSSGRADPRVTPLGRVMRALHLDELPQLWNVLRGDMALVGPRPERPEILDLLEAELPSVRDRLVVRPGVTGLAQIQQPADQTHDCFRRKLAFDLLYARKKSVWLDLRILYGTVLYLTGMSYQTVRRLAALPTLQAAYTVGPARVAPISTRPVAAVRA